ncbi:hypothetical protein LWI29_011826 [Acer saccharum]|uniref:Integrase catalytic domain-containing protein n=1 Tax=Acer saccharum TaxID=4024 RepID=A0AA39SDX9_ACESA|nr:hypothetical protein LWI29_011826 [Acer saccharum]
MLQVAPASITYVSINGIGLHHLHLYRYRSLSSASPSTVAPSPRSFRFCGVICRHVGIIISLYLKNFSLTIQASLFPLPSTPTPPPPNGNYTSVSLKEEKFVMMHNMSDEELLKASTKVPKIEDYKQLVPKVALMFLTKGPLPLAPLWEKFLQGHEGLYSIYVHSHPDFVETLPPNSIFIGRTIPSQDIAMDFIEGLPSSFGKNSILVVIDRLTKYAHFLALTHPFTAQQVAHLFFDQIHKLHGVPTTIVSDRDKIFTSTFWQQLFKLVGTKLCLSSAYHPQTDGQSERLNQCLENYLRCMTSARPMKWAWWLPMAEWWYNTNFHTALTMTPFEALYGYKPPLFL